MGSTPRTTRRRLAVATSIVLLVLTVPWGFTRSADSVWLGLPAWAFYSLAMSVVFAVFVIVSVRGAWPDDESPEEPEASVTAEEGSAGRSPNSEDRLGR